MHLAGHTLGTPDHTAVDALRLFADREVVLAVIASIAVGIAMFGTTVFLSQYMQVARGKSPTESGLLTIPMVTGLFLASTGPGDAGYEIQILDNYENTIKGRQRLFPSETVLAGVRIPRA